jgi:hypothetical protein
MKFSTKSIFLFLIALPLSASAQILEFQGDKFKGEGDKRPPKCEVSKPASVNEPFSITWNCEDDDTDAEEIRTELWIYRSFDPGGELVGNFLGFPAAAWIDETTLGATPFTSGLPVTFRLLARDRAGNASITSDFSVTEKSDTLSSCTLAIVTEETESTETTTGIPSSSVVLTNVSISTQDAGTNSITIASLGSNLAKPCEISDICEESDRVSFSASVITSGSTATGGTLTTSPGGIITSKLTGTVERSGNSISGIDVSGTGEIDDLATEVTLSCSGSTNEIDEPETDPEVDTETE